MADPIRSDPEHISSVIARARLAFVPLSPEKAREHDLEREREEAAQRRERNRASRTSSGIPRRVWPALDAPEETAALGAVREWLASKSTILLLTGVPDRGKTVAACWALDQRGGQFVKAIEIVRRGMFDNDFWDGLYRAPLVVLDDLGTEPLDEKGYALANVQALIDRAYDGSPLLIVTANLSLATLRDKYLASDGGRSLERVRECGQIVECVAGEGFRPKTAEPRRV